MILFHPCQLNSNTVPFYTKYENIQTFNCIICYFTFKVSIIIIVVTNKASLKKRRN